MNQHFRHLLPLWILLLSLSALGHAAVFSGGRPIVPEDESAEKPRVPYSHTNTGFEMTFTAAFRPVPLTCPGKRISSVGPFPSSFEYGSELVKQTDWIPGSARNRCSTGSRKIGSQVRDQEYTAILPSEGGFNRSFSGRFVIRC
jgi:hypothetical protein